MAAGAATVLVAALGPASGAAPLASSPAASPASSLAPGSYTLANTHNIRIPETESGPADPYPATIQAYGLGTRVSDVDVTLHGLSHTHGDDLDVELVAPDGTAVALLSDVCGNAVTDLTLTLDDGAPTGLPDGNGCASGAYRPTDEDGNADSWTVPPTAGTLAAFNGLNPNGPWRLYVRDDDGTADGGLITDGWSLTVTTRAVPALAVPGAGSTDGRGPAGPYPYAIPVGGADRTVTDVDVVLPGLTHAVPGSLEVLLVDPRGRGVVLMSGACGQTAFDEVNLVFDDAAEKKLGVGLGTCSSGTRKPTVQDVVLPFPAPAPPGPYATKLSAFDGAPANGTWQLYVLDVRQEDGGYLSGTPVVRVHADTKPPQTRITKRPKSSARASAKVKFTSTEKGAKFQCRLDGKKWRRCRSPLRLTHLSPRRHRLKVRAIDEAGNVDPTPAKVTWRVRPRR